MQPEPEAPDEELRFGPHRPRLSERLRQFRRRWIAGAAVVVVAAIVVALTVSAHHPGVPVHAHRAPPVSSPATSAPNTPIQTPHTNRPVVRAIGHAILGVHTGWELFARADDSVVRIQFARGRVTTTEVPALASGGPVSFVVGSWGALVRPYDFVPGYLIPDGRPASNPRPNLRCGGPALPGPRRSTVWIGACNGSGRRMFLTRLDGTRTGISLRVPAGRSSLSALPDGRGYVVFPGLETFPGPPATLVVRPGATRVLSRRAPLVAIGPTRWLLSACGLHGCDAVAVNRSTGERRRIRGLDARTQVVRTISPDGRTAALLDYETTPTSIALLDLTTGAFHLVPLRADSEGSQTMAFSPDSRWLFALDRDGILYAVSGRTGQVITELTSSLNLPTLRQLAVRDVTGS